MLMRVVAVAGVAVLLGGCASLSPSALPPVRDGSRPDAAESPPGPAAVRSDRPGPRPEDTFARAGIPRPRPAEAPPARLDEEGIGAGSASRAKGVTRKDTTRRAGSRMRATPGESLARPGWPEKRAGREGNSAVVALLESAREAQEVRQYGRAAAALERALKVEPRNPWIWHHLAIVRHRQDRFPEAEALARRSMSLSPGDARLASRNWRVIAAARHARGDAQGAREAFRRAGSP